ncbi:MAG: hypothetical protein NZ602_05190 [Thermoguttaceae bacterium]|nr:hypothetical protein [Thermoguttaceae bacterium]MDW8038311.1 hypothetical protein [Thermoguttaceae bacterium]
MGLVVGLVCADGLVIGSDSSRPHSSGEMTATYGPVQKTHVIGEDVLLGSTGDVGFAQRLEVVLRELREDSRFPDWDHFVIARSIVADAWKEFQATQSDLAGFGALVGFRCATGLHLCELRVGDLQPEFKGPESWFTALGPAQATANSLVGLLHRTVFQRCPPRLADGVFVAVWALDHARQLHPDRIQYPFHVAILAANAQDRPRPAWLLSPEQLSHWLQQVRQAEDHLETLPLEQIRREFR